MPIKGDVKKQFLAMREMVKDSVTLSAKFLMEQMLATAKRDGIVPGENMERAWSKKKNKVYKRYKEISAANLQSKAGRRIFHYSKFISRAGNLLKALTPAGGWQGNKLNTLKDGSAELEKTATGARAVLTFNGRTEIILKGGKNARLKDKVTLVDNEGNPVKEVGVRRRIFDAAKRSVVDLWNTRLKKELDKKAKEFK